METSTSISKLLSPSTTTTTTIPITTTGTTTTSTSTISSIEYDFLVDDDSLLGSEILYEQALQAHTPGYTDNIFALLIILICGLSVLTFSLSLAYLIKFNKHKQTVIYHLLLHLFAFKLVYTLCETFNILSSSVLVSSVFHFRSTNFTCFASKMLTLALEIGECFVYLLIWLVLLSQRSLLGLKCLYADFELRNASFNNPLTLDTANRTASSTSPNERLVILFNLVL
jgi:hypothetical protein